MASDKVGILMLLHVKEGKTQVAEEFLKSLNPLIEEDLETTCCFAFRISPALYGIFETFESQDSRNRHRCGKIVDAFFARSQDLFDPLPMDHDLDILAAKQLASRATR